ADEDCDGSNNEDGAISCKQYYADNDGDTYGAGSPKCKCAADATYKVQIAGDCYDSNANAHPGQGTWFVSNRGDGSYDYDCDGAETRKWTQEGGHCDTTLGFCAATDVGFTGSVPGCGTAASWLTGCSSGFFSCDASTTNRQQECH
ncbi:MAG: outer membrane protease, partial [Myxococcota bacterium]